MGRALKLTPRYDHNEGKWVLNLPPRLSPTGKRKRLFFERGQEEEALKQAKRMKDGLAHFKDQAKHIRPDLMEAAVKWDQVAVEFGFQGLAHFCAVKFAEMEAQSASPQLGELLDAFEADHRPNWSAQYYGKRWKPFRSRLHEIEEERISRMDEAFWREWLKQWRTTSKPGAETYNQQLGGIRALFELAAAKAAHPRNPLDDLPGINAAKRKVPVSEPAEVRKLLLAAWEHDREMVPYFAVCYFAGLRPDSEARRLHFEHIDWKEGHLKVDVTKTNDGPNRYVEIEETLRAWLRPWLKRKGSIIPDNFAKRRRRLIYGFHTTPGATMADEAKWKPLVPWGHDISRHSYGSYWEAAHRGEAGSREKIVANMGHRDFKTFDRYYKNARSRAEGKEFWEILPPKNASKVISIA